MVNVHAILLRAVEGISVLADMLEEILCAAVAWYNLGKFVIQVVL